VNWILGITMLVQTVHSLLLRRKRKDVSIYLLKLLSTWDHILYSVLPSGISTFSVGAGKDDLVSNIRDNIKFYYFFCKSKVRNEVMEEGDSSHRRYLVPSTDIIDCAQLTVVGPS